MQLSSFYIAIVLTVKHQIQITNPKLDALFVYKIEFQFKNYLYLRLKNLVLSASEAPLCSRFQTLMNSFNSNSSVCKGVLDFEDWDRSFHTLGYSNLMAELSFVKNTQKKLFLKNRNIKKGFADAFDKVCGGANALSSFSRPC